MTRRGRLPLAGIEAGGPILPGDTVPDPDMAECRAEHPTLTVDPAGDGPPMRCHKAADHLDRGDIDHEGQRIARAGPPSTLWERVAWPATDQGRLL